MTATAASTPTIRELLEVDPADLLVDLNIRHDTRLDADFCASIAEHGVLAPVVAVRTADGALRVGYGHRRSLAAVQTGRTTVPVVVIADEASDDAATVERLVTQWAENEHRVGLTTAERADDIGQLSAFGVTPTQIARRTRATKTDITAALAVHGSELARAASARYEFLDLTQAAVVAEGTRLTAATHQDCEGHAAYVGLEHTGGGSSTPTARACPTPPIRTTRPTTSRTRTRTRRTTRTPTVGDGLAGSGAAGPHPGGRAERRRAGGRSSRPPRRDRVEQGVGEC